SSAVTSGEATFYGGNLSGGACSFTTLSTIPNSLFGTAYSGAVWDNAAECGACVNVTGPNGNSITAMIVDECPECASGHLDLFEDAFLELGTASEGIIDISYTFVSCGITSPIVLVNKSGTSAYWFSMQVVNSNEAVESLEVSTDGGSTWQSTTRSTYNFFENSSGFGTDTVDVRVTSTSGGTITVSDVSVASEASATAASNF
ncbi:expansin-related, partial [Cryphonectria parasitica EP155]